MVLMSHWAELDVDVLWKNRMAVMDQQASADFSENDPAAICRNSKEQKKTHRCNDCPDAGLCDFDYCLHWWH
jgi:hypothetical protein